MLGIMSCSCQVVLERREAELSIILREPNSLCRIKQLCVVLHHRLQAHVLLEAQFQLIVWSVLGIHEFRNQSLRALQHGHILRQTEYDGVSIARELAEAELIYFFSLAKCASVQRLEDVVLDIDETLSL